MKQIDWQAYHAGSLPPQERQEAEAALANDPGAKAEYEGFLRFTESLALVRDFEPVPTMNLERALAGMSPGRKRLRWWPVLAAAGLAFAIWAVFQARQPDPANFETSKALAVLPSATPDESTAFINKETKLALGALQPPTGMSIKSVTCGKDWARYEFDGPKGTLILDIRANDGRFDKLPIDYNHGRPFRLVGSGLGWSNCGRVFYIHGIPRDAVWEESKEIKLQTETWH